MLETILQEKFQPNDADLDGDTARLLVLTGPNMAGKSTYMRQVGLLVLLAHVGSYVPARYALVGAVSSIHTRMGFTDAIGRGKSSFMVEMAEVAEILRSADDRSLVLLDEVGRGTSTFDGLALAWATLKELHDEIRCRTIVATHYHQLTDRVATLPAARNAHLAVREEGGDVVFLHRLVPGSTDRSYGIHVAKLAGVPGRVVEEAERTLRSLEPARAPALRGRSKSARSAAYTQAILLAATAEGPEAELARELRDLELERMTPLDAHQWLVRWRQRFDAPRPVEPAPST